MDKLPKDLNDIKEKIDADVDKWIEQHSDA